ncbi:MAG: prephenate dehydrogenase [Bacteroidota bacterium]
MVVAIVGIGLIGGSLALDLRANGWARRLIGVDLNPVHKQQALEDGLVDECMELEKAATEADIVVLAMPVGGIMQVMPKALDLIRPDGVVVDMGSTKGEIATIIREHPRRARAVLGHPMAGTEHSGPKAAVNNLFQGKAAILCDREASDPDALDLVERLFKSLFMRIVYMESQEHDLHAAYVSHVSHISSFVLALTVLDKEKHENNIFNLASGGFASTVRLAKSSPRMWADVYAQNAPNLLDVLDNYLEHMQTFRDCIAQGRFDQTYALMEQANEIRRILK